MYNLKIISSTVRAGRKGPVVAAWITGLAKQNENFYYPLCTFASLGWNFGQKNIGIYSLSCSS